MNIDLLGMETEATNYYITTLQMYGFISVINKHTRKVGDSKSCLDHYFIKGQETFFNCIYSVILEHKMTDRGPILLNIKLENVINNKFNKHKKLTTKYSRNLFQKRDVMMSLIVRMQMYVVYVP